MRQWRQWAATGGMAAEACDASECRRVRGPTPEIGRPGSLLVSVCRRADAHTQRASAHVVLHAM